MGLQKKIITLVIGVNLVLPTTVQALVIDSVKIESSHGEPLYAEIPFRYAESPTPIQVSIAQPFEIGIAEAINPQKHAHFNFYVRQDATGSGVIIITSSKAMLDPELDLVLKINDGSQVRMQQLRTKLPNRIERLKTSMNETALKPQLISNASEFDLNLPVTAPTAIEQSLLISKTAPPSIKTTQLQASQQTLPIDESPTSTIDTNPIPAESNIHITPQIVAASVTQQNTPPLTESENLKNSLASRPTQKTELEPEPEPSLDTLVAEVQTPQSDLPEPIKAGAENKEAKENIEISAQQHKVSAKESLWAISEKIAKDNHLAIQDVMKKIQAENQHAFINGNANRLRQGAVLTLPNNYQVVKSTIELNTEQKTHQKKSLTQPNLTESNRLAKPNQSHMSIVANNEIGTLQGAKDKGVAQQKQQNELTLQVHQQRKNTLSLQNNVRKLDQQLREKERRIALLNARLAELEQQLKKRQQNEAKNPQTNSTSHSNEVIPAVASALIASNSINDNLTIAALLQELI